VRPVNLIPQDQRRRTPRQGSGKTAYIVLGGLALLLVMVVGYVLTSNTVTENQNEADAARAEADQLEAQAAQQNAYTDFAQIAIQRTQSVAGVAATRFDWERFMRELSRVMPAGSWLQSADASVLGDPGGATTSDPAAAAATATTPAPAANLVGCTPGQDDVARMMVRLRQLYRVADVELNESTAGPKGDEPSPEACGQLYTFNLTVNFTPTPPERQAPRGSDRVPASLGGGS
jgi:Tfp pilus assembly protein PilN